MSEITQLDSDAVAFDPFGNTAVVDFSGGAPTHHSDPALNALLNGLSGDHSKVDLNEPGRSVRRADSIVIVNPQLIAADSNLSRLTAVAARAQVTNKPLALVAVTAWTPRSWAARKMIRMLVARSDLTLVADETSANVLAEVGIEPPFRLAADPAWASLASLMTSTAPSGDRVVWVSSNNLQFVDRYVRRVTAILRPLVAEGVAIQLQPSKAEHAAGLVRVGEMLSAELKTEIEVLPHAGDIVTARETYAGARLIVATDQRSLMAAAASGSPTVAVSLAPQAKRAAENLRVNSVMPMASDDAVAQALLNTLNAEVPVDQALVLQHIDRARAGISLVRMLLSQGNEVASDAIESLPLYPRQWRS